MAFTTKAPKTAAPKVEHRPEVEPEETVDDWSFVEETGLDSKAASKGVYKPVSVESVPQPIRNLVEKSHSEYFEELEIDGDRFDEYSTKYRTFDFKTVARAQEFITFCKTYAKGRPDGQISVRVFQLGKNQEERAASSRVRMAAMPLVKRESRRSPGSELAE